MKAVDEEVFAYIVAYKRAQDGLAPAMRDIKDVLTISSTSQVKLALVRLEQQGKIKQVPGKAGGIKVIGGRWAMASEDRPRYGDSS